MNILFIYTSQILPEKGGVQRVTKVLSDYFNINNINVYFLSQHKISSYQLKNQFFFPDESLNSKKNIEFLINFLSKREIKIIINQSALGGGMVDFYPEIKINSNVKIISVIHNSLLGTINNFFNSNNKYFYIFSSAKFRFLNNRFFRKILLQLFKIKYQNKYKKLYHFSDKIILLSESYYNQFKIFVPEADYKKLLAIHNPCTIKINKNEFKKINEILYVGRLDIKQKRLDLLLQIWNDTFSLFPNWNLNIVGDGPDLNYLKSEAKKMKLQGIIFLGHKNPIKYYERAKILCLTSSYEGFPLVLAEAINFNVVPILFNSFPSAKDIINNKLNGYLVKPFELESYVNKLHHLMNCYDKFIESNNAEFNKFKQKFSISSIGDRWIRLFNELNGY